jgi:hypothetical protein
MSNGNGNSSSVGVVAIIAIIVLVGIGAWFMFGRSNRVHHDVEIKTEAPSQPTTPSGR